MQIARCGTARRRQDSAVAQSMWHRGAPYSRGVDEDSHRDERVQVLAEEFDRPLLGVDREPAGEETGGDAAAATG